MQTFLFLNHLFILLLETSFDDESSVHLQSISGMGVASSLGSALACCTLHLVWSG